MLNKIAAVKKAQNISTGVLIGTGSECRAREFGNKGEGTGGPEVHFPRDLPLTSSGLLHEQLCLSSAVPQVKAGGFKNLGLMHKKPSACPKMCLIKQKYST